MESVHESNLTGKKRDPVHDMELAERSKVLSVVREQLSKEKERIKKLEYLTM